MKSILSFFVSRGCRRDIDRMQYKKDFAHAKTDMITGTSHNKTVKAHFPNAACVDYSNIADMILAEAQGKPDGYEGIR